MKAKSICKEALVASALFALLAACATPPKAAPVSTETAKPSLPAQAAPATPAAKPAVAAPDDLKAQATELRKKAFDLGIKDVLPDDYATAESAYSAGMAAYGTDNAASGASFADAKAKFGDVIKRGLPMLVAAEKDRAAHLRDTAVQKKASDLFPALLSAADADFAKPAASESSGDYETALAGYKASTLEYDVLYKLCDASGARAFLVSHDLAKWDTSNWALAEGKYASSQSLFRQDAHASSDAVDEAILRYGNVRNTAYGYYAADRKKASETERDRAAGIKADVAVKGDYDAAAALYAKAETDENAKNYEAASAEYDSAAAAFTTAYTHAKAKMDTAKGELDSLDSAIATAESAQSH
jgi:hypothetical protein